MKAILKSTLLTAAAFASSAGVAVADHNTDRAAIEAVLSGYETALNASDTESVLKLYAEDGVFMPQHSLPSIGIEAIRTAYDGVFGAISLDVNFQIDEIAQIAPNWAFVRTRSEGFVTINATGDKAPEANQELFVFTKTNADEWKIARYIFSTTNPPRQ
jgi:uncharacterized protein (TIGR02246 family)